MAKVAAVAKVNKAKAIREYLKENAKAPAAEAAVAVEKAIGEKVTSQYVDHVKWQIKQKKQKVKAKAKAAIDPSINDLIVTLASAKKFADACGGVAQAQKALAVFAKISG